jgi:glucose-1-phosphate thymidylyltransferase
MITKAILTGGGRATRLKPITTNFNKHLIPLANKPMIFHAIEKVVEAGVTDIIINMNPGEKDLEKVVGNGSRWGINISYFEQEGGPQGIAHVVKCAQEFVGDDPFLFYLSDNIILGSLKPLFSKFEQGNLDSLIAISKVPDPERFGVPEFDSKGSLVDLFEKPENPPSEFAITGIYFFTKEFFKSFEHIKKSDRGEYEITHVLAYMLKNGQQVGCEEVTGWWKDTGKAIDLIIANKLLLDEYKDTDFKQETDLSDVQISGSVGVGKNVEFGKNVTLKGPVLIGPNTRLTNCTLGPYVTVDGGDSIKNIDLKDSIIFGNCDIDGSPDAKIKSSQKDTDTHACLVINKDLVLEG